MASRHRTTRAIAPLAAALAAAAMLAPGPFATSAALAAEGGPGSNAPVPAGAQTPPVKTVTAATPATTAPPATGVAPAGGTTAPPAATTVTPQTNTLGRLNLYSGRSAQNRHAAKHGGGLSDAAIVLAAVGALLVLACAAWVLARMAAYEPRWTLSLRHSLAEAGHRASATWAELGDWVRLGR